MKKPIINQEQRMAINSDTYAGAQLKLRISCLHFLRTVYREHGLIAYLKAKKIKIPIRW